MLKETFKALSDPVRREILKILKKNKLSAGDICKNFDLNPATISYHLSILKNAELIFETKYIRVWGSYSLAIWNWRW